jgi:YspA, cpYpsA-related SLOG family
MPDEWPSTPPFRVLVTGSRTWGDAERLGEELTRIWREHPGMVLVHGAAKAGADKMADDWARSVGHRPERHPADWRRYGQGAGMIRNAEMVATGVHLVLAFIAPCVDVDRCHRARPHGSHGSSNCADLARKRGIEVREFTCG